MKRRGAPRPSGASTGRPDEAGGPVLLAALSGLLAAQAFPRFDLGGLAWVSLAPLLFALRGASPHGAAGLGLLFGSTFGGVTLYWWFDRLGETPAAAVLLAFVGFAVYYLLFRATL